MPSTVVFIGAGHLGADILEALRGAGHRCVVVDRSASQREAMAGRGFEVSDALPDLGGEDLVSFACLNRQDDLDAFYDPQSSDFLRRLRPGRLHVNCSTVSPQRAAAYARAITGFGGRYVEAPVSRPSPEERTRLTFFIGAAEPDIGEALELLDLPGCTRHVLGPIGSASLAKIGSNLMQFWNSVGALACVEAIRGRGVSEESFRAAVRDASGDSWSVRNLEFIRGVLLDHPLVNQPDRLWEFITKDPALALAEFGPDSRAGELAATLLQLLPRIFGEEQTRLRDSAAAADGDDKADEDT